MPRYFFDVTDAGRSTADKFGTELTDDDEARDQALGLLPDLVLNAMPNGDHHEFVVTVRNESGASIYEASLALSGRWWPGRR